MSGETKLEDPVLTSWLKASCSPLEVDFGCHRGALLVWMAVLHRDRRFLGIEKQVDRVEKCNARIGREGLSNALAIVGMGVEALRGLPEGGVEVFHLSFPDPWPKRKHASRRVFQAAFLNEIKRVLMPAGMLKLMTDDRPYFEEMCQLTHEGWSEVAWDDGRERVETAFEITFCKRGVEPCRRALVPVLSASEA